MSNAERLAKKFFQEIRNIDKQIDVKYEQLVQLEALATKVTATMSDVSVKSSGVSRGRENSMDDIIELKKEIGADIARLVKLELEANDIIRQIQNEKYRRVLESRYLLGKAWGSIAVDMEMTYQGVCKLHGKALQEAEKFFQKFSDS